jgi:hypothetical protein
MREISMTVPERVAHFVTDMSGCPYCDACIQERLQLARVQQVQQITASLAMTDKFSREDGECDGCGKTKKVTWAP